MAAGTARPVVRATRLTVDDRALGYSDAAEPGGVRWDEYDVDVVLECSGRFLTMAALKPYFERGVKKVVVAAPVKDERALNVVVGVNDDRTSRPSTMS
jgi:glyceraldehyde 3-phosphate dehydrogenase